MYGLKPVPFKKTGLIEGLLTERNTGFLKCGFGKEQEPGV